MFLFLIIGSVALRSDARRAAEAVASSDRCGELGDRLNRAADYLTDQARNFVAEDDRVSLELYRTESESAKRRERVLAEASGLGLTDDEMALLLGAKRESDAIAGIELHAIRLAAAARGLPPPPAPRYSGEEELEEAELGLSDSSKLSMAWELVFGTDYWAHKRRMRQLVEEFRVLSSSRLTAAIGSVKAAADRNFALVAALCAVALGGIALVAILDYRLVVRPVRRYIATISEEDPETGHPVLEPEGVYELVALGEAINRRRAQRIGTERRLRDSELKLRTNLLMMPLAAIEIDQAGRIRTWNPAAELMFGYLEGDVVGQDLVELVVPDSQREEILESVERIARGEVVDRQVNENLTKDGRTIVCEWYGTPLYDSGGAWIGWVSLIKDITEQHAEAAKILYLSRHDPLTGLLNRRSMQEKLGEEHRRSMRTGIPYSCVMLDIDKFKNFNDSYGHACGDVVLKGVADTLSGTVRATDAVSRWGGEEFLVLMPDTDPEGGSELAEKLRARIQDEAIAYGELSFKVTVTAGVAACRGEGDSDDECVRRADEALLAGKAAGRNRVAAST